MLNGAQVEEHDPDRGLLARVAGGDVESFGAFVGRHQEWLQQLCERMLHDPEDARDASQEVFLKVFRKAGSFQPRGKVSTWMYRIAMNHCLNRLRRRKVAQFFSLQAASGGNQDDDNELDPPDRAPDAAQMLAAREQWKQTRELIASLPGNQRAVLVLAKLEGLSYPQIAEVLEISEGAVESRLFRAMKTLTRAQKSERTGSSRR